MSEDRCDDQSADRRRKKPRRSVDRVADALEHLQAFFTIFALARAVATDLTACHKAGFAKVVSEKPCVVVALRASRTTSAGPLSGTWSAQGCRALPR